MGYIKKDFVEEILAEADCYEVIKDFVDLKRQGANYKGLSPFTNEKSPSFVVSPSKNMFKDFSSGKGGGAVNFLMETQGKTFPEAIEYIAQSMGRTVEYDERPMTEDDKKRISEKEEMKQLMSWAVDAYHIHFMALPEDHPAKIEVFVNRGYSEVDAKKWKIGFAPGNQFLRQPIVERGRLEIAKKIFLVTDRGDRYTNRVVYPIQSRDSRGFYYSGFGGRAIGDQETIKKYGKWINPSDTPLYTKDKSLFGFNEALPAISKLGYVILVESYNNVISLSKIGVDNVVGSCGTAFTENQIDLLAKRTKRIYIFIDGDEAGVRAAVKYAQELIKKGLIVYIIDVFPDKELKLDAHDWSKNQFELYQNGNDEERDVISNQISTIKRDGFVWLTEQLYDNSADIGAKARALGTISELLCYIQDDMTLDFYIDHLAKVTKGMTKSDLKKHVLSARQKISQKIAKESAPVVSYDRDEYTMPAGLEDKFEEYEKDIKAYNIFQHDRIVYSRRGEEGHYNFMRVSNFSIQIIQHMEDEKFPMKLVKMTNKYGKVRIFDTRSADFTSEAKFIEMCTNRGNFDWKGSKVDFSRLTTMLYDKMGEGGMINVLGWQMEGFWAFNNQIIYNGQNYEVDEYGIVHHKSASYYIPAGNKIYENQNEYLMPQKKCTFKESPVSFMDLASQMYKVHREHAYNSILFTLATYFSDLIFKRVSFFPILFLYGEASTGKDNLIEACQSFFGDPQTALTMTGKANTDKAKIRKFAQFRNLLVHMSEYGRGNSDLDQMLKSIWDRRGYERGTISSSVGTESVPIESSLMFTGNEYPDNDALITRIIAEEMNKDQFTAEEKQEYEKLKEMVQEGYSYLSTEILGERKNFEQNFRKVYKEVAKELGIELAYIHLAPRMIQNAAVLGATYKLLEKVLDFPFTYDDWVSNIKKVYEKQSRKRDTSNVSSKWWDAFYQACKTKQEPLRQHYEFSVDTNKLFITYKQCYIRMSKAWFDVYREGIPTQNIMLDKLKKSEAFIEPKNSHYFGSAKTSALVFDLEKTGIKNDLMSLITELDKTAKVQEIKDTDDNIGDELPKINY